MYYTAGSIRFYWLGVLHRWLHYVLLAWCVFFANLNIEVDFKPFMFDFTYVLICNIVICGYTNTTTDFDGASTEKDPLKLEFPDEHLPTLPVKEVLKPLPSKILLLQATRTVSMSQ